MASSQSSQNSLSPSSADNGRRRISKLQIVSHGETERTIVEACRHMGIAPVVVGPEEEEVSATPPVNELSPAQSTVKSDFHEKSRVQKLVDIALSTGVDAVHPGFGELATDPGLAAAVREAGMIYVGPQAQSLSILQDERMAMEYIRTHAPDVPVLSNATIEAMEETTNEMDAGRFVDVPMVGDRFGHIKCLSGTDQRSPEKTIRPRHRSHTRLEQRIEAITLRIGTALGYEGVGVVSFMVKEDSSEAFCLRVKAGVQAESAKVHGAKLVALQIYVASGGKLADLPSQAGATEAGRASVQGSDTASAERTFRGLTGTYRGDIAFSRDSMGASGAGTEACRQAGSDVSRWSESAMIRADFRRTQFESSHRLSLAICAR